MLLQVKKKSIKVAQCVGVLAVFVARAYQCRFSKIFKNVQN